MRLIDTLRYVWVRCANTKHQVHFINGHIVIAGILKLNTPLIRWILDDAIRMTEVHELEKCDQNQEDDGQDGAEAAGNCLKRRLFVKS